MFSRAKIASAVTVAALGGLAAAALASGTGGDPSAVQTRDDQPEVRTQVVRQTIHRTAREDRARRARGADDGARHDAGDDLGRQSGGGGGDDDSPTHDLGDDRGSRHGADDGPNHDLFDDRGDDDGAAHDAFDDHGGNRGHGGGDGDNSGHGGGDNSGHGGGDNSGDGGGDD